MTKDIVLNALLMAVWRRNPLKKQVLVHSDQGSPVHVMRVAVVPEITRAGGAGMSPSR